MWEHDEELRNQYLSRFPDLKSFDTLEDLLGLTEDDLCDIVKGK